MQSFRQAGVMQCLVLKQGGKLCPSRFSDFPTALKTLKVKNLI